jgi:hypothetical protein
MNIGQENVGICMAYHFDALRSFLEGLCHLFRSQHCLQRREERRIQNIHGRQRARQFLPEVCPLFQGI